MKQFFTKLIKRITCNQQKKANRVILNSLSDRQLRDIGLYRGDIESTLSKPCN